MFECTIFVDSIYGSERSIRFEADWVEEAEDRIFTLIFWRKRPVTFIRFTNGKHYLVDGHWAEKIEAAQTPK